MNSEYDIKLMEIALEKAREAAEKGEVPVGAVIIDPDGQILAATGNRTIGECDPCGHAEIRALRRAGSKMQNYRLPGTTLYVTLEPCAMCAAAMVHARIKRLVFGATDPKTGAILSKYNIGTDNLLNHTFEITGGILGEDCSEVLKEFFQKRR